jgi:hypothetical protein
VLGRVDVGQESLTQRGEEEEKAGPSPRKKRGVRDDSWLLGSRCRVGLQGWVAGLGCKDWV